MQQYQLTIQAQHRPEVLERILRVVRHRGFSVIAMQMTLENGLVQLALTVESERNLSLLTNQLEKLPDLITLA